MIIANLDPAMADAVEALEKEEAPFACATVIRTVGSTAAKPGSKALLSAEGEIISGWLGGGCTRSAVRRATLEALQDGAPKFISVMPDEDLDRIGATAGADMDGVRYARNGCPSKGTVDIFIEPSLPAPELVIFGRSPVAHALANLAPALDWNVHDASASDGLKPTKKRRCIVIATQGEGDKSALQTALSDQCAYIGFVGSSRKFASLSQALIAAGHDPKAVAQVDAPAGVAIGAVTPEEIALSILAQLTRVRRMQPLTDAADA